MPIYEYVCVACGAKLEAFQKINDVLLTDCQLCAQPSLQKLVSAAGFRLEGSGWYATGYEKTLKKEQDKKTSVDVNTPVTSTASASNASNTSGSSNSTPSKTEASI
jgi:putative FmdB family regulatory protein